MSVGGEPSSQTGGAAEPTDGGAGPLGAEPAPLIDDFEDGDADILAHEGRAGSWYARNDGQGMQVPADGMDVIPTVLDPPRGASQRALHTWGGPFAECEPELQRVTSIQFAFPENVWFDLWLDDVELF